MNTFLQICGGIGGLVLLYYGADGLVRGSVAVATKMKIPPLVIGLTLVAFGTSAPELVVSIGASLNGHGDVSIGNVVGSNICNIALILGVCAMITPLNVNPKLFKLDVPLMLLSSIVLSVFCYLTGGVNRWESLVFLTGIILYTSWSLFASKRDGEQPQETDENAGGDMRLPLALLLAIAGLFCLICGGKLLVNSAVSIAKVFDVPEAVIGLTVVAIGTSMPELATSIVAALKGEKDIAIGNVVGSNIFNILAILGVAPMIAPTSAPGISMVDLGLMTGLSALLIPMMKTGMIISRREGCILFLIYIGYTIWLISCS